MLLEEVRLLFERKGIFFFKMLQIRMGLSSSDDIFSTKISYVFQAHFLFLLDKSVDEAQSDEEFPGYVWLPGIINRDEKPECEIADRYMPQLLQDDTADQVPPQVKQHIAECSICNENLNRVHDILLEPDEIDEERAFCIEQITERLLEHFSYLDKTVDCQTVRKFLPQLADTQLAILIPTPITAHIDQCLQCRRKLSLIHVLKFAPEQLAKLLAVGSKLNPDQIQIDGLPAEDVDRVCKAVPLITDNKESGVTTTYELGESPEKLEAAKACKAYSHDAELDDYNAEIPEEWPRRPIDVGCNWIKYCLPLFVRHDYLPVSNIPLAALAHIDKCEQCKDDLAALAALKLEPKQLNALSDFYWEFRYVPKVPPLYDKSLADIHEQSERITELFVQMQFEQLSEKELKHICLCKDCRDIVSHKRQAMIVELAKSTEKLYPLCHTFRDIYYFDGALGSHDRYTTIHEGRFDHFRGCPKCLKKVQDFHKIIYDIADRKESGVIIKYKFDPQAYDKKETIDKAHLYDDFPITVTVSGKSEAESTPDLQESLLKLPPQARLELEAITETIRKNLPNIDIIVLFGGYLRSLQNGVYSCREPVFDILAISKRGRTGEDKKLTAQIDALIRKDERIKTRCQVAHHTDGFMANKIVKGHYFYCDIAEHGIRLYDNGKVKLAKVPHLPPKEKAERIHKDFTKTFQSAKRFYSSYQSCFQKGHFNEAIFALHHATEMFYNAALLVLTGFKEPTHNIKRLGRLVESYDRRFVDILPLKTAKQRKRHTLLRKAIVEGRYAREDYNVTAADLKYLGRRIKLLGKLTEKIYYENIDSLTTAPTNIIHRIYRKVARANWAGFKRPLKRFSKVTAIVIISIMSFWYFSNSSLVLAKAYGEVVTAVKNVVNVCLRLYTPDQTEPIQIKWVSKTLNIALFKVENVFTLRDMANNVIRIKDLSSDKITTRPISEKKLVIFRQEMEGTFGLMPFESLAAVPGAKWRLADKNTSTGEEVYELTWEKNTVYHKWRYFYPNSSSDVPSRVGIYEKVEPEKAYTLINSYEVSTYQNDMEIRILIESIFGVDVLEPHDVNSGDTY